MLLATWFLVCFFKRFRSFNAKNLGSVGQRAAKLLAVKVGGLKKGLPAGPGTLLSFGFKVAKNWGQLATI